MLLWIFYLSADLLPHPVLPSFSQGRFLCFFGLPCLLPLLFFPVFGVFCVSEITEFFLFLSSINVSSVPYVTLSYSVLYWFLLCSVHDTHNNLLYHLFANALCNASVQHSLCTLPEPALSLGTLLLQM